MTWMTISRPVRRSLRRLTAVLGVTALAACTSYVHVPPQAPNQKLSDILMPGGALLGGPDPTTRDVHGYYWQAKPFFDRITQGAKPVQSNVGEARQLPDGTILTYVEQHDPSGQSVVLTEIIVQAPGIPIQILHFHVLPGSSGCRILPVAAGCDGGGDM